MGKTSDIHWQVIKLYINQKSDILQTEPSIPTEFSIRHQEVQGTGEAQQARSETEHYPQARCCKVEAEESTCGPHSCCQRWTM